MKEQANAESLKKMLHRVGSTAQPQNDFLLDCTRPWVQFPVLYIKKKCEHKAFAQTPKKPQSFHLFGS